MLCAWSGKHGVVVAFAGAVFIIAIAVAAAVVGAVAVALAVSFGVAAAVAPAVHHINVM